MKNIKGAVAIKFLIGIIFITCIAKYFTTSHEETGIAFAIDCFSSSVTICSIASFLFCSYLWKLKIFKGWFVKIPNLEGLWEGTLNSTWEGSKTIIIELKIKQSLFNISCVMSTVESKSESISCDFIIDENNQKNQLTYTYLNTPDSIVRERSPIHYGSVILDVEDCMLSGNYWTDRKTTGCLKLSRK